MGESEYINEGLLQRTSFFRLSPLSCGVTNGIMRVIMIWDKLHLEKLIALQGGKDE